MRVCRKEGSEECVCVEFSERRPRPRRSRDRSGIDRRRFRHLVSGTGVAGRGRGCVFVFDHDRGAGGAGRDGPHRRTRSPPRPGPNGSCAPPNRRRPHAPDPTALLAGAAPRSVPVPVVVGPLGIPEIVLNAYRSAELAMAGTQPGCGLQWNLLAGIGKIESGHAGGGQTDAAGTTVTPILGPTLNGHLAGNEIITDTDRGALDGDPVHDRAVGPMQFIPSTWVRYASDGNGDGVADPNNVFDATLSAARYLCAGGLNLNDPSQLTRAVLRYNNSSTYMANVLSWSAAYRTGGTPAPAVPVAPAPPERFPRHGGGGRGRADAGSVADRAHDDPGRTTRRAAGGDRPRPHATADRSGSAAAALPRLLPTAGTRADAGPAA
ncbi:lytic transglycosylase [Rhodococcus hoagii]|nr:lytic transglycosylase [Prescottella equi]